MRLPKELVLLVLLNCFVTFDLTSGIPQQHLQGQPLRSVQLGDGGLRPVSVGNPLPNFSQQLAFGPQYQNPQSPQPQQLQQLQRQPQFFRPQQQQPLAQPQQLQPTYVQHQRPNTFPASPNGGGLIRPLSPHPQPQQLGIKAPAGSDDDEYEDEEYEDAPAAAHAPAPGQQGFRRPPQAQIRPVLPLIQEAPTSPRPLLPQRLPLRLAPQQPESPVGPPRFQIAQPQQQQQVRRPPPPPQPLQQQPIQRPLQQIPAQQQQIRLGQDQRLINADRQTSTPTPIKTLDRYMRTNEDGSTSWGYTNEDGSFKEETIGVDCVVRGKYGYVDPDGVKREYEYQSGNPCDPNKRGQPEEEEEEAEPGQQQQRLGGILAARPQIQYQQPQQFRQQRPQAQ